MDRRRVLGLGFAGCRASIVVNVNREIGMNDDAFQAKVLEHMGSTDAKLDNIEGWMGGISSDVKILNRDGCAKGGENERNIAEISKANNRSLMSSVAAGGGTTGIILAVVKLVATLKGA